MRVILLSYDTNHEDIYHTIMSYEHHWPNNKFIFRVPWNIIYPTEIMDRFGDKVEPIQTSSEVKPTINNLLKGIDDNEWVLWNVGDFYIHELNAEEADIVYEWVTLQDDPSIHNVVFSWCKGIPNSITNESEEYKGLKFFRRKNTEHQWFCSFYRAKIIKQIFNELDEPRPGMMKDIDHQMERDDHSIFGDHKVGKWYAVDHNIMTQGESRYRSLLTKNGADSFKKLGCPIKSKITEHIRMIR